MSQKHMLKSKGSQTYKIISLNSSYYKVINITYNKKFDQGIISNEKELLNFFKVISLKELNLAGEHCTTSKL